MSNLLLFSGTGRQLGLSFTLDNDIKATQISYRIKNENKTFIFGMIPVIRELVTWLSKDDVSNNFVPYSRRPFMDKGWEELVDLCGGSIPVNVYMKEEGELLSDDEVALVIESTDERFAWVPQCLDSVIYPHLSRIIAMSGKLLGLRIAIRKAVVEYSDREATDLCKLFLLDPEYGVANDDMQLLAAMFKVLSPLEPSPIAAKFAVDKYSESGIQPTNVLSADVESPIGLEIGERLAHLLSISENRHLNLYIKDGNDEETAEQMIRFVDILKARNAPLVINIEDGNCLDRAKYWMKELESLVGMEQNSMGLQYPEKQFAVAMRVCSESDIEVATKGMAEAGYTIDGYSFTISPDDCFDFVSSSVVKTISYKTKDWDESYVEHELPVAHSVGKQGGLGSVGNISARITKALEESYPHDFKEEHDFPGRYSGWWVRSNCVKV